jgi:hypothetical protein
MAILDAQLQSLRLGTNDSPSEFVCPFCQRSGARKTKHHLIPKSKGGKNTLDICRDCHKAIHACFSHKELAKEYHTIEKLLTRESFRKMVGFIAKQHPGRKIQVDRPKDQQYRKKYQ